MRLHEFRQSQTIPVPVQAAWDFFSQPANLSHLTPPDVAFRQAGGDLSQVYPGQMIWYSYQFAPFIRRTWVTEMTHVNPGVSFVDEQRVGPYKLWHHRHGFRAVGENATELTDHIIYALPFWPFGEVAHGLYVRPLLDRVFAYRRQELARRFGA